MIGMTIDQALARVEAHAATVEDAATAAAIKMLCGLVRTWWGKV